MLCSTQILQYIYGRTKARTWSGKRMLIGKTATSKQLSALLANFQRRRSWLTVARTFMSMRNHRTMQPWVEARWSRRMKQWEEIYIYTRDIVEEWMVFSSQVSLYLCSAQGPNLSECLGYFFQARQRKTSCKPAMHKADLSSRTEYICLLDVSYTNPSETSCMIIWMFSFSSLWYDI